MDGDLVEHPGEAIAGAAAIARPDMHVVGVDDRGQRCLAAHVPLARHLLAVDDPFEAVRLAKRVGNRDMVPRAIAREALAGRPAMPLALASFARGAAEQETDLGSRGVPFESQGVVLVLIGKLGPSIAAFANHVGIAAAGKFLDAHPGFERDGVVERESQIESFAAVAHDRRCAPNVEPSPAIVVRKRRVERRPRPRFDVHRLRQDFARRVKRHAQHRANRRSGVRRRVVGRLSSGDRDELESTRDGNRQPLNDERAVGHANNLLEANNVHHFQGDIFLPGQTAPLPRPQQQLRVCPCLRLN